MAEKEYKYLISWVSNRDGHSAANSGFLSFDHKIREDDIPHINGEISKIADVDGFVLMGFSLLDD